MIKKIINYLEELATFDMTLKKKNLIAFSKIFV